jgi:hypothetical protein
MGGFARADFEILWAEWDRDKFSEWSRLPKLKEIYRRMDDEDQALVGGVLIDWIDSGNPRQTSDALAMISAFEMTAALPVLRRSQERIEHETDPLAPYYRERLDRVIERLDHVRSLANARPAAESLTPARLEAMWARANREAQASKASNRVLDEMKDFYRRSEANDRAVVDGVLALWVVSGESAQRSDALALIDEFRVRSALPALKADRLRLAYSVGPAVPHDIEQLDRMIVGLDTGAD